MWIQNDVIYLGDNGRAYCGEHLGYTAKTSGRDLSGQALLAITPEMAKEEAAAGWEIKCEQCSKPARMIYVVA